MNFEYRVAAQVPILLKNAEKLRDLSESALSELTTDMNDHFGVMAIFFLSKQYEHMKAIIALRQHRDSELVARSMLEGLVQFVWAAQDQSRAFDWRVYGHVHNFRQLREDPGLLSNDPEAVKRHEEALAEYGTKFFTAKARAAESQGGEMPKDPFFKEWTGKSLKELCGEVQADALYRFYRRFSDWHHWSFAGLSRALDTSNPKFVSYKPESKMSAAHALVLGFQCLYQTCEIAGKHFDLHLDESLERIRNQHFEDNQGFMATPK